MKKAVRYFLKLGNTRKIAEAIAQGAGVEAISISDEPGLVEFVDVLYLGGLPMRMLWPRNCVRMQKNWILQK